MKKLLILAISLCAVSFTANAQKSLLNTAKKVATESADQATGGKVTSKTIVGAWQYKAPATRIIGKDKALSAGSAVLGATMSDQMAEVFDNTGIKRGFCSITFRKDGKFSMPIKGKTISGSYSYSSSNHVVTLRVFKSKYGTFTGYAYVSGRSLQLLLPADKFVTFMSEIGAKSSSMSSFTTKSKKGDVYIGFEFEK